MRRWLALVVLVWSFRRFYGYEAPIDITAFLSTLSTAQASEAKIACYATLASCLVIYPAYVPAEE